MPRGQRLPKWPIGPDSPDWPKCKCGCELPVAAWTKGNSKLGILNGQPRDYAPKHNGRRAKWDADGNRWCPGCERYKPIAEYALRTSGVPQDRCRACRTESHRAWFEMNKDRTYAQQVEYRRKHAEARSANTRKWRRDNPEHAAELSFNSAHLRRLREKNVVKERIVRLVVLERDDGVCGICGVDVNPNKFAIDHVIPITRGGTHTYDNVQVAHPRCNTVKHDRLMDEMTDDERQKLARIAENLQGASSG